jgi:poly-gamma-glutamate synthesis protein (capsule biosynthesis protein)
VIITGDIASPSKTHCDQLTRVLKNHSNVFCSNTFVCNFEGMILEGDGSSNTKPVLFNHPSIIEALTANGSAIACLANNHVLDLPDQFTETTELLNKAGIPYGGASKERAKAHEPIHAREAGKDVFIFNACWDFLLYNQKNPTDGVFVEEIDEIKLLKSVASYHDNYPSAAIIVYLHWSFDLEKLPFPMYRQFSKALIDAGADIVTGSHSHCVQGGEKYKNGYIVYGLGNFFIPHNVFAGGKIKYPEFAKTELALEWDVNTKTATCHWFEYQHEGDSHSIKYNGSERFEESERLKSFSPFAGMDHQGYVTYFRKHRRKKFLIPVYKDYKSTGVNRFYTWLLKKRAKTARFLAQKNIIGWQR